MEILLTISYSMLFIFLIQKMKFFDVDGISKKMFSAIFLLKIIAGLDNAYQGDVVFSPGYTVGYLPQEPEQFWCQPPGGSSLLGHSLIHPWGLS